MSILYRLEDSEKARAVELARKVKPLESSRMREKACAVERARKDEPAELSWMRKVKPAESSWHSYSSSNCYASVTFSVLHPLTSPQGALSSLQALSKVLKGCRSLTKMHRSLHWGDRASGIADNRRRSFTILIQGVVWLLNKSLGGLPPPRLLDGIFWRS